MRYDVTHGHWHFGIGIEVQQTNFTFQFNRYFSETFFILRGIIDNASVAFLKSVSIDTHLYLRLSSMFIKPIRRVSNLYFPTSCITEHPIIRTNEQNGFRMNVF